MQNQLSYDKNVKLLVDQYFEGQTSLEEEALLRAYFNQPVADIEPELLPFRPLFVHFQASAEASLPSTWEEDLMEEIDLPPVVPLRTKTPTRLVWRVAASLLLIAAFAWLIPNIDPEPNIQAQTFDWSAHEPATIEEALDISTAAFRKMATELNQGAKQAVQQLDHIQEMGQFNDE